MPKGFFKGPKAGVQTVSQNLGIGYGEMLVLRCRLGQALFSKLLIAHGLPDTPPFEANYVCPGVRAMGTHPASPCRSDASEPNNGHYLLSYKSIPGCTEWLCHQCHSIASKRDYRVDRVDQVGNEQVQAEYRDFWNDYSNNQRDLVEQGNSTAIERNRARTEYFAQWHKKRKEKGLASHATGSKWKRKSPTRRYPQAVTEKLELALEIYLLLHDQVRVDWRDIILLFRDICDIEAPNYENDPEHKIRSMFEYKDGSIVWYSPAYEEVAEKFMSQQTPPPGQAYTLKRNVNDGVIPNPGTYNRDTKQKNFIRIYTLELIYDFDKNRDEAPQENT